jgi:hypothetical protein
MNGMQTIGPIHIVSLSPYENGRERKKIAEKKKKK